jgi:hypothetical protein
MNLLQQFNSERGSAAVVDVNGLCPLHNVLSKPTRTVDSNKTAMLLMNA